MRNKTTVHTRSKHGQTTLGSTVMVLHNKKLAQVEDAQIVSTEPKNGALREGTTPQVHGIVAFSLSMLIVLIFKGVGMMFIAILKFCFKVIGLMLGFGFKMLTDRNFRSDASESAAITERHTATRYNIHDARHSNITINNYK